ncbi:MAG: phosphoribosyltransferase family protein [Deltaproteobacteria bacterium]|nr:phosphoribosyltransferase family protein [Deltaproteobacteria bacterium]
MVFRDREQGGRLLAEQLEWYRASHPMVLGLARGGVPVALEVARFLGADLDLIVARKIGAPGSPEYAIGAIAEGGAVYVRRESLPEVGLTGDEVAALAEREGAELARRVRFYRGDRPMPDLEGRTAIIVDDGVATGATARAAARSARLRGAARVVLAAPVIAAASVPELKLDFDDVVAVELPSPFFAVGRWYARFEQVSGEEVLRCLRLGRRPERETEKIPFDSFRPRAGVLDADLVVPAGARGLVMFVHGSGSTRRSPRNRLVASEMQGAGFATLLFDLLTPAEAAEDESTARLRFDIPLLTARVSAATRWASAHARTRELPAGYFGASTGAAAALASAAENPELVAAVVSRGGRPDLVPAATLARVRAPVLLLVGSRDEEVLRLNRSVLRHLANARLAVVPGATHLFEEPGALEEVTRLAAGWFSGHLAASTSRGPSREA